MADDTLRIVAWPKENLSLAHSYEGGKPVPLYVGFGPSPVQVRIAAEGRPLEVSMAMQLAAERPLPLCISLCEPICARSDYQIDISIFDQPFGRIAVSGLTRLFNCKDTPKEASAIG